jgi:hypothetical protein
LLKSLKRVERNFVGVKVKSFIKGHLKVLVLFEILQDILIIKVSSKFKKFKNPLKHLK